MSIFRNILLLIIASILLSKPIDIETATKVANNFVSNKLNSNLDNKTLNLDSTIRCNQIPLIYVFRILPSGFVLIAADDAAKPILSYSLENNFENNLEGKNISYMRIWFS